MYARCKFEALRNERPSAITSFIVYDTFQMCLTTIFYSV